MVIRNVQRPPGATNESGRYSDSQHTEAWRKSSIRGGSSCVCTEKRDYVPYYDEVPLLNRGFPDVHL